MDLQNCSECRANLLTYGRPCSKHDPIESQTPVTILDVATSRLIKKDPSRDYASINGQDLADVGFEMIGGCAGCGETLGCFNAHPTKRGFWACKACVGQAGYSSVEEFETESQSADLHDTAATVAQAIVDLDTDDVPDVMLGGLCLTHAHLVALAKAYLESTR